jgi:hypothetical protein
MSLFVASNCQILGDTAVNVASWSKIDTIVAFAAFSVDEKDREINKVIFSNNEVLSFNLLSFDC